MSRNDETYFCSLLTLNETNRVRIVTKLQCVYLHSTVIVTYVFQLLGNAWKRYWKLFFGRYYDLRHISFRVLSDSELRLPKEIFILGTHEVTPQFR